MMVTVSTVMFIDAVIFTILSALVFITKPKFIRRPEDAALQWGTAAVLFVILGFILVAAGR